MNLLIAIAIGTLVACGFYRLLGKGKLNIIVGLVLLSQGVNLLILGSAEFKHNAPALLEDGKPIQAMADPLPQALVLTAIVIGFGILSFMLSLTVRK